MLFNNGFFGQIIQALTNSLFSGTYPFQGGPPIPPETKIRITDNGNIRITDGGNIRITDN